MDFRLFVFFECINVGFEMEYSEWFFLFCRFFILKYELFVCNVVRIVFIFFLNVYFDCDI